MYLPNRNKRSNKSSKRSNRSNKSSKRSNRSNSSMNEKILAKETMKMLFHDAKEEDMITLKEIEQIEYGKETKGGAALLAPLSSSEVASWAIQGAWPGNYGCRSAIKSDYLMPGIKLDRFGIKYGAYLGLSKDNYVSRSMNRISMRHQGKYTQYYTPSGNILLPPTHTYHRYELNRPIISYTCIVAKAFDKPGGARQFIIPAIDENVIQGIPLNTTRQTTELIDPSVAPTKFYRIDYLLRKNILRSVPIEQFPSWN